MPAEKTEFTRWPDEDLGEKCLHKCDVWHSVSESDAHRSRRLISYRVGIGVQPIPGRNLCKGLIYTCALFCTSDPRFVYLKYRAYCF